MSLQTLRQKSLQKRSMLVGLFGRILVLLTLFVSTVYADSPGNQASWNLPMNLSDKNTSVHFEVDSTWHMVHGKAHNISGTAYLSDGSDPSSVQVSVEIPIKELDTDNSMRDSKLRSIMAAEEFPLLRFIGAGLAKKCTPALVLRDGKCHDTMPGSLTIRDISKKVALSVEITKVPKGFTVKGLLPIIWADYGVEDPSILVAKVEPLVNVLFTVQLPDPS
jgi:polyisoprenoid-binding protein YceI